MIIKSKMTDEELLRAIYRAANEYSNLIGKEFLLIGKNSKTDYFWFQCYFEKKFFMHLLGICSKILTADEFYDRCNDYNNGNGEGITINECTPSRNHNRTTINEKASCCAEMLKIENAKYMKVGLKNKISQFVDFTYAYGNIATLGFCDDYRSSFPITLIPRSIDEFSTQKYKIIFAFEKPIGTKQYEKLLIEIKKGILEQHFNEFPENLKLIIKYP